MSLYPQLDDLMELRHIAHTLGLASHHLVNSALSGMFASVFRGAGMNFEEVREYQQGDDIRNMDWKVTARANRPYLKLYQEERERDVLLLVDKGPQMQFGTMGTFKSVQAARVAALIGWAANRQNDRVGGMVFGEPERGMQFFRPGKGRRALWRVLHALTEPPTESVQLLNCLNVVLQKASRGISTGSLVFVIADFNQDADSFRQSLGALTQKARIVLIPVDDPRERELPDMGLVTFEARAGGRLQVDTGDALARDQYRKAWETRREQLVRLCGQVGALLFPVRTDDEVHVSLMRHLSEAGRHSV
jgi:uncharacterized protein (DUF58 family)